LIRIILLLLILSAALWWIFWNYFDTYHLVTVRDGILYRDGVRSLHQFDLAVRKTRVKTVVCLLDDQEILQPVFTEEVAYCQSRNIAVMRIPITLGGWPDGDQVSRFLAIVADPSRQPVLVHCAQGVRRTGMMIAAYQISVLHMDKNQAIANIRSFGHSQRTVDDVQRFIEVYDPVTQRMTQQLQASQE